MPLKNRAISLIEVMIAVVIIAILSIGIAVAFNAGLHKAKFKNHQAKIINIYQQARASSLSSRTINDIQTDYYLVNLTDQGIILDGFDVNGLRTTLDEFSFDPTIYVQIPGPSLDVYYFPPEGKACFDLACTPGQNQISFTLASVEADFTQELAINFGSGFPEILDNDI